MEGGMRDAANDLLEYAQKVIGDADVKFIEDADVSYICNHELMLVIRDVDAETSLSRPRWSSWRAI